MADDAENDDQWLYGDTPDLPKIDNKLEDSNAANDDEESNQETEQEPVSTIKNLKIISKLKRK